MDVYARRRIANGVVMTLSVAATAFGLLWLVQFAVLERVVFRAREVSMPSRTARRLADSRR